MCVDEVNECDDNCKVNDVDTDDGDEVSGRVHNMDDIVSSDYVNDDDVLRPVHTVDDGELSAIDVKDECKVRCEVVGDDKVDDNLGRVHTDDVMMDECVDESDGLDGRMNDCLSNCCRDISSYLMWLILCIILVTTAVCDALLGLVPHIRVRSVGTGDDRYNFVGQLTLKLMKFSDCSTAFEVAGYHRALSLVSLYGDGSQQLWQLSNSTSVCVSDACSGICTVAESVRHVNHSLRVTADFTPTPRRMRRRSSTSMVRRASSIRKTTSDWQDVIGTVVRLMLLHVHIRQGAYTCQAQVHGANHSRLRYQILVIFVIVLMIIINSGWLIC